MRKMAGAALRNLLIGRRDPRQRDSLQTAQLRSKATPEQEGAQKDEGLSLGVWRGSGRPTAVSACTFLSGGPGKCPGGDSHLEDAGHRQSLPLPCLADLRGCLSGLLPKSAEP